MNARFCWTARRRSPRRADGRWWWMGVCLPTMARGSGRRTGGACRVACGKSRCAMKAMKLALRCMACAGTPCVGGACHSLTAVLRLNGEGGGFPRVRGREHGVRVCAKDCMPCGQAGRQRPPAVEISPMARARSQNAPESRTFCRVYLSYLVNFERQLPERSGSPRLSLCCGTRALERAVACYVADGRLTTQREHVQPTMLIIDALAQATVCVYRPDVPREPHPRHLLG